MKLLFLAAFAATALTQAYSDVSKVICNYDSKSYVRETQAKMLPPDLEPALSFCTHLVYGYAGIQSDTYKMVPLNENLDLDVGHGNYRVITNMKKRYPGLKVMLSVGGGADDQDPEKYKRLLETPEARASFINSAVPLVKNYGFDGLDLAWQLPEIKPKKIRSTFGSIWHGIKKTFGTTPVDDKETEHREGMTALIRDLKTGLRRENLLLSVTVLPNVNTTIYYEVSNIINHIDYVNLGGYDYYTPTRNPKEADYTAPLYALLERKPDENVDALVNAWIRNGAPGSKLVLSIPTFGRAWKLDSDSSISGVPPLTADGPAEAGPYTKQDGLLSYPEVCAKLINPNNQKGLHRHLRKVTDPSKRYGTYAFIVPDDNGEGGMWVSYEDPDTAGNKAGFVRAKGLGGVAIVDLSLDDFRGLCTGDKYPILRAAKFRL